MAGRRDRPEEIVSKLRQVEVLASLAARLVRLGRQGDEAALQVDLLPIQTRNLAPAGARQGDDADGIGKTGPRTRFSRSMRSSVSNKRP